MIGYTLNGDMLLLILPCSATTLLCTVEFEVLVQLRRSEPLGALLRSFGALLRFKAGHRVWPGLGLSMAHRGRTVYCFRLVDGFGARRGVWLGHEVW